VIAYQDRVRVRVGVSVRVKVRVTLYINYMLTLIPTQALTLILNPNS
jgi:hypothetical protein